MTDRIAAKPSRRQQAPLEGVKVLDFGRVLAAPHTTRHLADMGADVIKIERPGTGDDTRLDPYVFAEGLTGSFMQQNWGKRSLAIDLRHDAAQAVIHALVRRSDVLVENFRPGVMERLGFGYDALADLNPALIMCSISAYGQTGPYAGRVGYGQVVEAAAAIPELTGDPEGPPMPTQVPIADNMASTMALAAICAALYRRRETGLGEYIDVSLLESAFQMHDMAVQQYIGSGGTVQMTRRGILDETWVPWGFFEGRDGWVCIVAGNDRIWLALTNAVGRPDLAANPRYATFAERAAHRIELYAIINEWVRQFASVDEIVEVLARFGVPSDRVNNVGQAIRHPQIQARGMLVDVVHPRVGPLQLMNTGMRFLNSDVGLRGTAPDLGADSRSVLNDIGCTPAEVGELFAAHVVFEPKGTQNDA